VRIHLIDGTFELYRAHFSPRPGHTGPNGEDFKASVGVARNMLSLLDDADEKVTHLAIAFDNPIVSFRNRLFDGYKTDEGVPPELRSQFDLVEMTCRALGIVVWSMDEHEADDGMATGARRWRDEVEQVRILSPDKDLGQCLVGTKVVQVDRIRRKEMTAESAQTLRGISVSLIPDFLALVGDTADGIPGVPGFGEKTTSTLLAHFGGLDAIPDDPAKWPPGVRRAPALAAALASSRAAAQLYRRLATLVEDVPLKESLADLEWKGAQRGPWEAWCAAVKAPDLLERPRRFQ